MLPQMSKHISKTCSLKIVETNSSRCVPLVLDKLRYLNMFATMGRDEIDMALEIEVSSKSCTEASHV